MKNETKVVSKSRYWKERDKREQSGNGEKGKMRKNAAERKNARKDKWARE